MAAPDSFAFVQFEFGFVLGPADGRYIQRPGPDAPPERVVVLQTLVAPRRKTGERGRLRRRQRPSDIDSAEPEAAPTSRATLVRADPFGSREKASAWLDRLRGEGDELADETRAAAEALNAVLRAHRLAASDPYARDIAPDAALAVRVGYGAGEQVADGRYVAALDVPAGQARRRKRAETLAPQEHLAAMLGGRERHWASEELILRARSDIDAGRPREAALQARIALETLLAELGRDDEGPALEAPLGGHRGPVAEGANAALREDPPAELQAAVRDAVAGMESAVRRRRLGSL